MTVFSCTSQPVHNAKQLEDIVKGLLLSEGDLFAFKLHPGPEHSLLSAVAEFCDNEISLRAVERFRDIIHKEVGSPDEPLQGPLTKTRSRYRYALLCIAQTFFQLVAHQKASTARSATSRQTQNWRPLCKDWPSLDAHRLCLWLVKTTWFILQLGLSAAPVLLVLPTECLFPWCTLVCL